MTTMEEINQREQLDKDIRKWTITVCICVAVLAFGTFALREEYSATLSMWWMLAYSLVERIWGYAVILVIGSGILYVKQALWKKYWILILLILLILMGVTIPSSMKKYRINGERSVFAKILVNEIKDIAENEYEIINCSDCEMLSVEHSVIAKNLKKREYAYYYLSVNNGNYVLPILPDQVEGVSKLEKSGIGKIKVYANTKFIVEINGVPINKIK